MRPTLNRLAFSGAVFLMASIGGAPALAQNAFISNNHDNTVSIIDVPSGTVIGAVPVGAGPEGVTVAPNGTTVYVANTGNQTVSVIDASQFPQVVTATIAIPGVFPSSVALTSDGRAGYVPNGLSTTPQLTIFQTSNNAVLATVPLPGTPQGIAVNPASGNVYVATGTTTGQIAVFTSGGTSLNNISVGTNPLGVAVTPDGSKIYVTQAVPSANPGTVTIINAGTNAVSGTISVGANPHGIAVSPDGTKALIANTNSNSVTLISTATNTVINTIAVGNSPFGVSFTPDGTTAYVTNQNDNTVSVVDPGTGTVKNTIAVGSNPLALGSNFIGRAQPQSALLSAVLPGGRSVQIPAVATVFASIINVGTTPLNNCRIVLPSSAPATMTPFFYQTTDPVHNNPTGTANTPVTIPGNVSTQSFLIAFQDTAANIDPTQPLLFVCDGTTYAPIFPALNTVDLVFNSLSTPTPDIIAESATATGNGIVNIPFAQNQATAFALATTNAGDTATLTASVDTGSASVPLTATICQTNPATSACLAAPSPSVDVSFAAASTPTFSIFISASGSISLSPATNRVFVRFKDSNGLQHGSTSVAVTTNPAS
ncbi:MAG TPA: hypothetical protein VM689_03935 [Aliidongia sp.]|nr:hypothetical protein [Aliidongia sp.]